MSSGIFDVTVLIRERTITGHRLPPEGALEIRRYAARDEEHAREVATRGLTSTEEIVSLSAEPDGGGDHG